MTSGGGWRRYEEDSTVDHVSYGAVECGLVL